MKVINKSRKVIGIKGEPLLPGTTMELPEGYEKHPSIIAYLKKGVIVDADKAIAPSLAAGKISEEERAKIAEEAIAQYKAQQAIMEAKRVEKEAEIKAVKNAKKKEDLMIKAIGMGIEVEETDSLEVLKDKIVKALEV